MHCLLDSFTSSQSTNAYNFNYNVNAIKTWWRLAYLNPRTIYFVRTMVRLLLNVSCYGFHVCKYCGFGTSDSLEHIIFQCEHNKNCRSKYWPELMNVGPKALIDDLESMTEHDRCVYILNCFNSEYIVEWSELYQCVGKFLHYTVNEYLLE